MGDGNDDDSPLFRGWSTKDLVFVGVALTGAVTFAMSLDKRVEISLNESRLLVRSVELVSQQHREIMDKLVEINKWVATIQSRQDAVIQQLHDTDERSIECLRNGGTKR